jgi:hypothetical protein
MTDGQTQRVWRLAAIPLAVGAGCRMLAVAYVQVLHGNFLFSMTRVTTGSVVARPCVAHEHLSTLGANGGRSRRFPGWAPSRWRCGVALPSRAPRCPPVGLPVLLVVLGFPAARCLPSLDVSTASDGGPAPLLVVGLYAFELYLHRATVGTAAGICVVASAALVQARVHSLTDPMLVARVARAGGRRVTRWRRRERHALIGTQATGARGG